MHILFIGTNGVYHPLIAAHLHLQSLNTDDYRSLQCFADHELEKNGRPLFIGFDSENNRIYTLGVGPDVDMVKKSIEDLRLILGAAASDLRVVPIQIKAQLLLLLLHKLSADRFLRFLILPAIIFILRKQVPAIQEKLSAAFITT